MIISEILLEQSLDNVNYFYIYMIQRSEKSFWIGAAFAYVALYTTSLFGDITSESSQPHLAREKTWTRNHNTGNCVPYSFRTVRGFF